MPANVLKIDQSFVRGMLDDAEDLAIVEGVVSLADVFHRDTIAEGLETPEHGVLLMRLGCDRAQGYGIARPMPATDVPAWVAAYRPDPSWRLWAETRWDLADMPLLIAQRDHMHWVNRVVKAVDGEALLLTEAELTDHHQCRYGRWYDDQGKARYGHLREYAELDAIHVRVHQVGPEIIRCRDAGDLDAARAKCRDLLALRDQIVQKLTALQHTVARTLRT